MSHTQEAMADMFKEVKPEPETSINIVFYQDVEGMPARVEHWTWSGISALSLVLRNVDAEPLSDDQLKALVDNSSGVTIKRSDDFTYVNFGFKTDDD